jgi:hypothetical protein
MLELKRSVRNDNMRLDRFMQLATITSRTDLLDNLAIVFPAEL